MTTFENWWEEKRAAYLYGIMAAYEANAIHKKLFLNLQTAAEDQAAVWQQKLLKENQTTPASFTPDLRTRIVIWLIKHIGTQSLHHMLAAMKIRGMSVFTQYHTEHKHTSLNSASNLRAAIFGINDGLISNMSLILGLVGAHTDQHFIVVASLAGLLAGACSMGAGEYISVRSQREVFEHQIAIEKQELAEYPEEEAEELSLIYQARGMPEATANELAKIMISHPQTGLDTLAREELGLNPEELVSPIGAMLSSFISFAAGAAIPVLPFLLTDQTNTAWISISLTASTLFGIGAILSLFTNRNPWWSGLRMLGIGCLAGAATFLIGALFR